MLFAFLEVLDGWGFLIFFVEFSLLELLIDIDTLYELVGLALNSISLFFISLLKETLYLVLLFVLRQSYSQPIDLLLFFAIII